MTTGLSTTFELLTSTANEAAEDLLLPALDSPVAEIRELAMHAVLTRRCLAGQKVLVARAHTLDDSWRMTLRDYRGTMAFALRDSVLAFDTQVCKNGCELALDFREYELIPGLINASEDETNPNRGLTARTLLQLTELLFDDLAAPREAVGRRDPQLVRQHVIGALEHSIERFNRHRVGAVLEAFLLLVQRDNAVLRAVLNDPRNVNYLPLADMLTHSPRPGVMRLVLSFLDDVHAPSAAITLLAYRHDEKFVEHLLRKIGHEPSAPVAHNLRRIENIAWLQSEELILNRLDEAGQHAAVQLAIRSGVNRRTVYKMLEVLLVRGKAAGRRAAAKALADFNGAEANSLAMRALSDNDPQVQAAILPQLRQRGIPGAVSRLIELLESPHAAVRSAARASLAEFSFRRYLAAYDMLDEEVRRSTGEMVAKVDPETPRLLADEMNSQSRTRRLRAISMAQSMRMLTQVELDLHDRLLDEDHLVRAEAARALAACNTNDTHEILRETLNDRSLVVREAAEFSLLAMDQPAIPLAALPPLPPWQEAIR